MPTEFEVQSATHAKAVKQLIDLVGGLQPVALRAAAAEALGRAGGQDALRVLLDLSIGLQPVELKVAAARGLGELARGK